ncbi:MAG: hypothetical protein LBQ91_04820 [Oscillospiraceae bacterium]|jgi:hypothetical protein|nr:hypothetical protein [Oscillospiraceae bacterium]
MKKIRRTLVSLTLFLAIVAGTAAGTETATFAASNQSKSKTTPRSGQAYTFDHSDTYTSYNGSYTNYKVDGVYYGNNVNMSPWYAKTATYYHSQGSADLSYSVSVSTTYTFSASADIGGKTPGSLGFSRSSTSSNTVTSTIPSTGSYYTTGNYAFAVKFRMVDVKTVVDNYVYYNGNINSHTTKTYYGTVLDTKGRFGGNTNPRLYKWIKTADIGTTDYSY